MNEHLAVKTFLFSDIEGSTQLWEREPQRMAQALARHDALARSAVAEHHGTLVKMLGDGVCAAFDDPADGVAAAVALQRSLADPQATHGVALSVRCGLHAGVTEHRDDDYFGSALNRAARIMASAHGGQILVSDATAALLRERHPAGVALRELGSVRLRGLEVPERVHQVVHAQLRQDFPALRSLAATPNNLPLRFETLIGRNRELAQLHSLIATERLVTVTGPGGVGKSRLVLDAAWACVDRFPDGVWLVELAALADPAAVPSCVTTALGMAVTPAADPLASLTYQLADRRVLVVLDNCEHVVDAVAALLEALRSRASHVHVLASSQEPIGIDGEHVLRLRSLAVPVEPNPTAEVALEAGAVQLFVARARLADPCFVLDDRIAPAVATLCRRLDGIPLALEMAAARIALLGAEGLAARLNERFRVLTAGKRTALPRQRTLHATLDWSHGLLSASEQAVFRRLGVFAGSFALPAAVAAAADGEHDEFRVIECLAGLCDKSLVVADPGAGEVRYRLLETARAYALERLAEAGETAAVMRRHAIHYRHLLAACFDDWALASDATFRARYAPELDNLRAAIVWSFETAGESDTAIALVGSSVQLWISLSLYVEADAFVQRAVERLAPATPPALEAELWQAVASLYGQRNQQTTIRAARKAADLYGALGDSLRRGFALRTLGSAHAAEGDDEAEAVLLEARPILEASGRPRLIAMSHTAFAVLHAARGNEAQGMPELQTALELWRAAGAESAVMRTRVSIADQLWSLGDLERAISLAREVLEEHRASPFADRLSRAYATANLFGMLVEHGDLAEAQSIGRALLPELREFHLTHGWVDHFASYHARTGREEDAVVLVAWADAHRLARGLRRQSNERRAREFALARAGERVKDPERLMKRGAALSEEEALRLAPP